MCFFLVKMMTYFISSVELTFDHSVKHIIRKLQIFEREAEKHLDPGVDGLAKKKN